MTIDRVGPLNKILKAGSDIKVKKNDKASNTDSVELSPAAKKMADPGKTAVQSATTSMGQANVCLNAAPKKLLWWT